MNEITGVTKTQTKKTGPCRSGLDKPYRKKGETTNAIQRRKNLVK